jgi:hypothetical protein
MSTACQTLVDYLETWSKFGMWTISHFLAQIHQQRIKPSSRISSFMSCQADGKWTFFASTTFPLLPCWIYSNECLKNNKFHYKHITYVLATTTIFRTIIGILHGELENNSFSTEQWTVPWKLLCRQKQWVLTMPPLDAKSKASKCPTSFYLSGFSMTHIWLQCQENPNSIHYCCLLRGNQVEATGITTIKGSTITGLL